MLSDAGVVEITDRGGTAGWLLSAEDMAAIVEGYSYLEEQLERMQIAALFEARNDSQPLSGEALKAAVRETFDARKAELRGVVDGD